MLLLLTIALVLVGAVSLIIGFIQDSLLPIYISIACSVIAAAVLVVFSRVSRREVGRVVTLPGPRPEPVTSGAAEPAFSGVTQAAAAPTATLAAPAEEPTESIRVLTRVPTSVAGDEMDEREEEAGEEELFPIADYDDLRVSDIVPLLSELDPEELELVREAEENGKSRSSILDRIDQLTGAPPARAVTRPVASRATTARRAATGAGSAKKAPARSASSTAKAGSKTAGSKAASASKAAPSKAAASKAAASKAAASRSATSGARGGSKTAAPKPAAKTSGAKTSGSAAAKSKSAAGSKAASKSKSASKSKGTSKSTGGSSRRS